MKHGFFSTKFGRRRRYRCKTCGQTVGRNTNTVYETNTPIAASPG